MADFRFSPIHSEETFQEVLDYITVNARLLGKLVTGEELPVDTLTIFTHSQAEYDFLAPIVLAFGERSKFSHGATLYIDSDFEIQSQRIRFLGIRSPDDTRPQVGYGDFPVENFDEVLDSLGGNEFASLIESGRGQPLIELRHPDFDVLGFIVNAAHD